MGILDLQSMRDEVRFTVGGYTSIELSDAIIDRWLRWSQNHIARPAIYEHRELFSAGSTTLVLNTPGYALSTFSGGANSNVQAISIVVNESRGQRLLPRSLRQYYESAIDGSGTFVSGRPSHYMVAGVLLHVYPVPNATHAGDTLRVWYWRTPTALAAAPATGLAEDWDEVIVQGAVWRAFRALNLQDRAELAKAEFGQLINEVGDRLRGDMREDMADRGFDVAVHDYQQESF